MVKPKSTMIFGQMMKEHLGRKSRQAVCRSSLTSLLPRVRRRSVSLQARRCIRSGGLADIEKLEIGVPVLTYNEETGRQEYKQVKKVMRRMTRRMCAMELSNGTTLEVTPRAPFLQQW